MSKDDEPNNTIAFPKGFTADKQDNSSTLQLGTPDDPFKVPKHIAKLLTPENVEKLETIAECYGIPAQFALAVCISDTYDSKVANINDAAPDLG